MHQVWPIVIERQMSLLKAIVRTRGKTAELPVRPQFESVTSTRSTHVRVFLSNHHDTIILYLLLTIPDRATNNPDNNHQEAEDYDHDVSSIVDSHHSVQPPKATQSRGSSANTYEYPLFIGNLSPLVSFACSLNIFCGAGLALLKSKPKMVC